VKFSKITLMAMALLVVTPAWGAAKNCKVTVLAVNFGLFDNLNFPVDANGQVAVGCAQTGPVTIQIDAGQNSNNSFQPRRMSAAAGQTLNYNLYVDSARTVVWGDGLTGSTQTVVITSGKNNAPATYPIYGRIFSGQAATLGVYSDNIIVSVIY